MVRTRSALAALLAVGLLGACSDDDPEPDIADPTTSAISTPPTTATSAPTVPPTSSLGPEDTVRAWVSAWNLALDRGDTSGLRAFDADSCRGCDELIGPVEQIALAGGDFEGGIWKVDGLTTVHSTAKQTEINLGVDVSAGSTRPSAGASPTSYPATRHVLAFTLTEESQAWRISVIEVLS